MANKTGVIRIESNIGRKNLAEEFAGAQPNFSALDFSEFVAANKGMKVCEIILRTDGGNLDEAYDIRGQIRELKKNGVHVITKAYRANSAGTVLFIEGNERLVADPLQFTIHNSRIPNIEGQPKEVLRLIADELEVIDNRILDTYSEVLGFTPTIKNEIQTLMVSETNLDADLAIKYGFATGKIVDSIASVGFTWTNQIAALVNKSNNDTMSNDVKQIQAEVSGLKSFIKGIAKKAGLIVEAVALAIALADGKNLYAAAEIAEGVAVFEDEPMTVPATDGDHVLADGRTVTVASGSVTAITDAPEAVAKKDDKNSPDAKDAKITELETQLADALKESKTLKNEVAENKKVITEIVAKVEAFSSGKAFDFDGTQVDGKKATAPTASNHKSLRKRF